MNIDINDYHILDSRTFSAREGDSSIADSIPAFARAASTFGAVAPQCLPTWEEIVKRGMRYTPELIAEETNARSCQHPEAGHLAPWRIQADHWDIDRHGDEVNEQSQDRVGFVSTLVFGSGRTLVVWRYEYRDLADGTWLEEVDVQVGYWVDRIRDMDAMYGALSSMRERIAARDSDLVTVAA